MGGGRTTALALGVKTLVPTTDPSGALLRMERHPHGTIADSFGLLDLAAQGFELLFAATWFHHRGSQRPRNRSAGSVSSTPT